VEAYANILELDGWSGIGGNCDGAAHRMRP
jgi:hypothetical protein